MWIAYAMAASLLWGISYTVNEQLMKKLTIPGVLLTGAIGTLFFALIMSVASGTLSKDLAVLKRGEGTGKLLLASICVYVVANSFILLATKSKNATMAGMIEISYPLFTALFAYLIFKETQINAGTFAGSLLVLSGIACIYFFGKNI